MQYLEQPGRAATILHGVLDKVGGVLAARLKRAGGRNVGDVIGGFCAQNCQFLLRIGFNLDRRYGPAFVETFVLVV